MIQDVLVTKTIEEGLDEKLQSLIAFDVVEDVFVKPRSRQSVFFAEESGSTNAVVVVENMHKQRENLNDFDVNCILNVYKTGWFFRLHTRRTYMYAHENRMCL